jgi:hypothetical protein
VENCTILLHFFPFLKYDFVYAINLKNKPWSLMPNGMPMVNANFLARELMGSKHVLDIF